MQILKMDFQSQSTPPVVPVMQSDAQSRFIGIALYDGGAPYAAPENAAYTVQYHGPGPNNIGWYDTITLSSGTRKAVTVDSTNKNIITLELAEQALRVNGNVFINICVVTSTGYMLHTFPILCRVTGAAYVDPVAVRSFFYVTGITSEQWLAYVTACQDAQKRAEEAAATFEIDPTLSVSGKAADAKATGDAVGEIKEDLGEIKSGIINILYESGAINTLDGSNVVDATKTRTGFIDTANNIIVRSITISTFVACYYGEHKQYISSERFRAFPVAIDKTKGKYVRFIFELANATDGVNFEIDYTDPLVRKANAAVWEEGNVSIGITYTVDGKYYLVATTDDLCYKVIKRLPDNLGLSHPVYNCSLIFKYDKFYIACSYIDTTKPSYQTIYNLTDGNVFSNTPIILVTTDFEVFEEHVISYDSSAYWGMNAGSWFGWGENTYLCNLLTKANAPVVTDVWGTKSCMTTPAFMQMNLDNFTITNIVESGITLDSTHYYIDQSCISVSSGFIMFIKNEYSKTIATFRFSDIGQAPTTIHENEKRLYAEEACHVRYTTNEGNYNNGRFVLFTDLYTIGKYSRRFIRDLTDRLEKNPPIMGIDYKIPFRAIRDFTIPINNSLFMAVLEKEGYSVLDLYGEAEAEQVFSANGKSIIEDTEDFEISTLNNKINLPSSTISIKNLYTEPIYNVYGNVKINANIAKGETLFALPIRPISDIIVASSIGGILKLSANGDIIAMSDILDDFEFGTSTISTVDL